MKGSIKPLPFKRILLKLSGEALMGEKSYGLDPTTVERIALDIKSVHALGCQICIVIGGGNIFRGINGEAQGIDRSTSDYMGMLATVINALALQNALEKQDVDTRVQSAIPMETVCESYVRRRALYHLEKKRVIIFAAGSGSPFFTTDTAAVLRANEMGCDVLMKGTKVDGVYSSDPTNTKNAKRFEHLNYLQVLSENLRVMDMAAIALARENHLPLIVFSIQEPNGFIKALTGHGTFTSISNHANQQQFLQGRL